MAPDVHWLTQAQDQLERSLGRDITVPGALNRHMDELDAKLTGTFPDADAVVVRDVLQGHSVTAGKYVLQVEVIQARRASSHIVKTGDPEKLMEEWEGWRACCGNVPGRFLFFMSLSPGATTGDNQHETLVYEDANQVLRAAGVTSLQAAVLDCCQWGYPSAESISDLVRLLFHEMSERLYRVSTVQSPTQAVCDEWCDRLTDGWTGWEMPDSEALKARRMTLTTLAAAEIELPDPSEYLQVALDDQANLPEMLRGRSHGDLHGMNILAGLVEGEAEWSAVFDYDHMKVDNYVGWDFVKLEMELKVRALGHVFRASESEFVEAVRKFETHLCEETEDLNNQCDWPKHVTVTNRPDRLRAIVLAIRRMAKRCLESHRGRRRRWLDEYYFLLACYGVYAGRFANYQRRDLVAAHVCSAVAAARYDWTRRLWQKHIERAERTARQQAAKDDGRPEALDPCRICWASRLASAKVWARRRDARSVHIAVDMLKELAGRFKYVIEIRYELVFAYLEMVSLDAGTAADHLAAAEAQLNEIARLFPEPNGETLCRWGRIWKDRGDAACQENREEALRFYRFASGSYQDAYALNEAYYPAINVATCLLLMGESDQAGEWAYKALAAADNAARESGREDRWIWATRAEAHLLLMHFDDAARLYRQVCSRPDCDAHTRESMRSQARRILRIEGYAGQRDTIEAAFD